VRTRKNPNPAAATPAMASTQPAPTAMASPAPSPNPSLSTSPTPEADPRGREDRWRGGRDSDSEDTTGSYRNTLAGGRAAARADEQAREVMGFVA
jgi:hypothetical protein